MEWQRLEYRNKVDWTINRNSFTTLNQTHLGYIININKFNSVLGKTLKFIVKPHSTNCADNRDRYVCSQPYSPDTTRQQQTFGASHLLLLMRSECKVHNRILDTAVQGWEQTTVWHLTLRGFGAVSLQLLFATADACFMSCWFSVRNTKSHYYGTIRFCDLDSTLKISEWTPHFHPSCF